MDFKVMVELFRPIKNDPPAIRELANDFCIKNPVDIELNRICNRLKIAENEKEVEAIINEVQSND